MRASNVCNFSCRTCDPISSSGWAKDAAFLTGEKVKNPILKAFGDRASFNTNISGSIKRLKRVLFAGGEPLLQVEHYDLLAKLIEAGNTKCQLSYNTNLSILKCGPHKVIDLWNTFENIDVCVSLDGTREQGVYLREGMEWSVFADNIRTVIKECPHVKLYLNITVSNMNVYYLPEMINDCMESFGVGGHQFLFNPVSEPIYYALTTLPPALKTKVKQKVKKFCLQNKSAVLTQSLESIVSIMEAQDTSQHLKTFRIITRRLDHARGQRFEVTFPELKELMELS